MFMSIDNHNKLKSQIWINIAMTHHCNLNCRGCAVFSPLAPIENLSRNQIINDFIHLKNLFGDIYDFKFSYLGGEPLLNPDFLNIVNDIRLLFPNSYQDFLTNAEYQLATIIK